MKEKGFSLVEIMISMVVGLFISAALIQYLSSQRLSNRAQQGLSYLQENTSFALYVLNREARMAGFQGCPKISDLQPNVLINNFADTTGLTTRSALNGAEGSNSSFFPTLPTWLSQQMVNGRNIKPNTDVLIIRKAGQIGANLNANMANNDSAINLTNKINFSASQFVLVSDCERADLIKTSNGTSATTIIHNNIDNSSASLSKAYMTDAMVFPYQVYAFYVRDSGRLNQSGNRVFSLYRMDLNGIEEEISEGIEDMQLTYGVDYDGDGVAEVYQNATTVENNNGWANVVSLNVSLLANSVEAGATTPQTYIFNGTTITPGDLLLRRQINSYISLRNKK